MTVSDDDGGSDSDTVDVIVSNVAPTAVTTNLSASSINENDTVALSGTFNDPGVLDTHSVVVSWGDGSPNTTLNLTAGVTAYSTTHQYLDDRPTGSPSDVNTITVTVTDKDGGVGNGGTSITVNNVAPVITSMSGPTGPAAIGSTSTVAATFTDVGTQDTHKCTFIWDDATAPTTVNATGGSCSATHTYAAPGVYTVTVTVTDDDTGSDTEILSTFIVIYDPGAGFVTGGGWINVDGRLLQAHPVCEGAPARRTSASSRSTRRAPASRRARPSSSSMPAT